MLDGDDAQFGTDDWLNIGANPVAKKGVETAVPTMEAQLAEQSRQAKATHYQYGGQSMSGSEAGNWVRDMYRDRIKNPDADLPKEAESWDLSDIRDELEGLAPGRPLSFSPPPVREPGNPDDRGMLDEFDRNSSPDGLPVSAPAQEATSETDSQDVSDTSSTSTGEAAEALTAEQEAQERVRENQKTEYLHGGKPIGRDEVDSWDPNDPRRLNTNSRVFAPKDPEAGWDKPKIGRFRGAMSWLGNKLTFGMFGGKDYRARQEDLGRRRNLVSKTFDDSMKMWDEMEFDQQNPDAFRHELTVSKLGARRYVGRDARPVASRDDESTADFWNRMKSRQRADIAQNPRYNTAPAWLKQSKYARRKWDKLVGSYADTGRGGKPRNLLTPLDQR